MTGFATFDETASPLILLVPGLGNSGPDHWQSRWEQEREDCRRVELGMWDKPHRNTWVNQLNLAIHRAANNLRRPVILVAHSLGCLAVAWWVRYEQPSEDSPVKGALLVAPPEVDFFPADERLSQFAPTPPDPFPFPSILVASRNDPFIGSHAARRLAKTWGSQFADAGAIGHINAESEIGSWQFGKFLLDRLLAREERRGAATADWAGEGGRAAHERVPSPAAAS